MVAQSGQIGTFLFVCFLALLASLIAKRNGFYRFPLKAQRYPLSLLATVGVFIVYVVTTVVILPLFYYIVGYIAVGQWGEFSEMGNAQLSWIQLGTVFIAFAALLLYMACIKRVVLRKIIWGEVKAHRVKQAFKDIAVGALTWVIAYPILVIVSQFMAVLSRALFGKSGVEQAAVKVFKHTLDKPLLLVGWALSLIVVVPIFEEILFRGFLQTWLRKMLGRGWAILISAIIFALVHFSFSQGVGNIELIGSLLVLSLYLGFIYERQTTLFAPIGLHMTFNAVTVIALTLL